MRARVLWLVITVAMAAMPLAPAVARAEPPAVERRPAERTAEYELRAGADGMEAGLPVTRPEELLERIARRGDRGSVDAHRDALRLFLDERWDEEAPLEETPPDDAPDHSMAVAPWRWSYPAGDLDGDGLADVLAVEDGWNEASVEASSGEDGSRLWFAEGDSIFELAGWPAGDLTGDGAGDLLGWDVSLDSWEVIEDRCELLRCTYRDRIEYTWVVSVRSGRDGTVAWSQTYPGVDTLEETWLRAPVLYDYAYRWEATNALVLPFVSDGRLVLNGVDASYTYADSGADAYVVWSGEGGSALRASSYATVIDLASGAGQVIRSVEDAPLVGLLEPLSADRPELIWSAWNVPDWSYDCLGTEVTGYACDETHESPSFVLELLGADLEPRWQREFSDVYETWVLPLGRDLDGGGDPDIQLLSWLGETGGVADVISAETGSTVWSRTGSFPIVLPGGNLGGTGEDAFVLTGSWAEDDLTVRVERVAGGTGESLLTTEHTAGFDDVGYVFVGITPLGDVDGDESVDLGVEIARYSFGVGCGPPYEADCAGDMTVETDALVEQGRTGAALREGSYDSEHWYNRAADLDGDGTAEVFEVDWQRSTTEVVSLARQEVLWSVHDEGFLMAAGDHTGDGVSEVLYDHWGWQVASLDGGTGSARWTVRF